MPVGAIDLLATEESARILTAWNDTAHEVNTATTLVSLLDETVTAAMLIGAALVLGALALVLKR